MVCLCTDHCPALLRDIMTEIHEVFVSSGKITKIFPNNVTTQTPMRYVLFLFFFFMKRKLHAYEMRLGSHVIHENRYKDLLAQFPKTISYLAFRLRGPETADRCYIPMRRCDALNGPPHRLNHHFHLMATRMDQPFRRLRHGHMSAPKNQIAAPQIIDLGVGQQIT
jgi:hypothetical protein